MGFLSPLFLAGALAAALPIALHLLKRHPDVQVRFSAVHLLRSAPMEHAHRRHLRELILLALRVAALLLLAFAFARPFFTAWAASASEDITVIAIDTSLSMSAPGQFERARQLGRQALSRVESGHLAAVLTFADTAHVVSPASADRALAASVIDGARPGAGGTSYRAGLNAAAALIGGRPGRIVVVTDLQASGWGAADRVSLPASVAVEVADVGVPPGNLAVTAARLSGNRIVAVVRNAGGEPREARVHLLAGTGTDATAGSAAGETRLPLGPGQTGDVSFPAPAARWVSVAVEDTGGIAADNTRFLVLGDTSRHRVLVVSSTGDLEREAFYVEQALVAAGTDGADYAVEGVAASALQSWDSPRLERQAAVVLLSTRGLEHKGRELLAAYARNGGGMLIPANENIDGEVVTELLGGAKIEIVIPDAQGTASRRTRHVIPGDLRHPVLQPFAGRASLGLVTFQRVAAVRATGCQSLARFTTGEEALLDCEAGKGRALVLASDLDNRWNDFPRHATFVPFVHEAVRYLMHEPVASEYLVADVPQPVPPLPGVATISAADGAPQRMVAVNVDARESDADRMTTDAFTATITPASAAVASPQPEKGREAEESQHLWRYALGLMVLMLAFESLVAGRVV